MLGFRLEIKGAKPEHLKLTGNLQDRRRASGGKLEIAVSISSLTEGFLTHHGWQNVWPYRPSGDHSEPPVIQRGTSTTVTMTGRMSGFPPGLDLGILNGKTDTWTETHAVIRTHFKNVEPRIMFEMDFSPLPKKKNVPDALSFAILVASPARPVAFDLEFEIRCGDVSRQ